MSISNSRQVWRAVFALCALSICGTAGSAAAQQVKPYFLVIVDTSGSMDWCAAGAPLKTNAQSCACYADPTVHQTGQVCQGAFATNSCGFSKNKIGDAKCALRRIIDSTGDAVFGLMEFRNTSCAGACATNAASLDCEGQLLAEIQNNNSSSLREWVDGQCSGCTNNISRELVAGGSTALAKSLRRANEYLRGSVAIGSAWPYPTNIAGANTATSSPIAGDPQLSCRQVSVILLTDGVDTCEANLTLQQNNPPLAAAALNTGDPLAATFATKAFHTYVIGFGSASDYDPAVLNNIAMSGGTDANAISPGIGQRYFPAANEADLSVALNQIIAAAQPPPETCNGIDDNCNGLIDEGLPKYCDKAHGHPAADLCTDPGETNCDGIDDNCDGLIDNGVSNACGTCGALPQEVCDGVDNNCNSQIDEGTSTLAACGLSKGTCKPGQLICVAGGETCQGAVGPTPEICDCKDNNCDGTVDEDPMGTLCGTGMRCSGCQCVPYCDMTVEFTAHCPTGLTAEFSTSGECLCIEDKCDPVACPKDTIMRDDAVACAPSDPSTGPCLCRGGACVPRCDGVMCADGQICNPKLGNCVENSCRGLGCAADQLCDPASGKCVTDACAAKQCAARESCRAGTCEASCAGVTCGKRQSCTAGHCTDDPCAQTVCNVGQACEATTGKCLDDPCQGVACKTGQVCSSTSGACEADPCWNVRCPQDQLCTQGQCSYGPGADDVSTRPALQRVLAAGGGGCACSVAGARHGRPGSGIALGCLCGLVLLGLRRRRLRTASLALAVGTALALALTAAGCSVSPFCINCQQTASQRALTDGAVLLPDGRVIHAPTTDASLTDAQVGSDASLVDASTVPRCTPTGPEICNGIDDDCNFKVDDDVVAPSNDCLQQGVCAGTVPTCVAGNFVCLYPALYEPVETLCDGQDNDCSGVADEAFPQLTKSCQVGIGECKVTGTTVCKPSGTGVMCQVSGAKAPGDEICDGKDNDCDGLIDEAKADPGSNPSYVHDDIVQLGTTSLWVYKYEASRPDAKVDSSGILKTRACSRAGVLPWTDITYTDALAACAAAGLQLCGLADWMSACQGTATCEWSYTPTAGTCHAYSTNGSTGCNGHDITTPAGTTGNDALLPTGSKPLCYADFGGSAQIFDLSGNAKEWTTGSGSPSKNPLRGGSYNNLPEGLRCDFDFSLGAADLHLPNIGFRCCSSTAP